MTRSSSNIFCNSVESGLMFCLRALAILASNSFLCLSVMCFFKGCPPMFVEESRVWIFNYLMNREYGFWIHVVCVCATVLGPSIRIQI